MGSDGKRKAAMESLRVGMEARCFPTDAQTRARFDDGPNVDKLGQSWTKNLIRKMIKQFPKTDVRYWREKVAFQTPASRTLSVQIQHAGNRAWIGLGTANRDQAAFQARKLYEELRANGWEETMRRRKGIPAEKKVNITIGEFIAAVRQESMIYPKTIESYAQALRKIAGDIIEKESD